MRLCYASRARRSSKVTSPTDPGIDRCPRPIRQPSTDMMRTEEARPVRLADYRPPDWLVETVHLDVRLDPTRSPVHATLKLRPNPPPGRRRRSISTATGSPWCLIDAPHCLPWPSLYAVSFRLTSSHVLLHLLTAAIGRLCCKSLFAPSTANFSGCRSGFRVNMWGTSPPGDKLTGDFGNEPDTTLISDRGLFRLLAGNLSPGVFRLLQHNRHNLDLWRGPTLVRKSLQSGHLSRFMSTR
jgi:hypothetical protein